MSTCIVCESQIEKISSLGLQPLANKYPKNITEIEAEFKSSMEVFFCESCLYINIPCAISRDLFFEDYFYLSSVNKELVEHFKSLADHIKNVKSSFVLDIGSNDGILLGQLIQNDIKCLGIDPSENVSKIANESGLQTIVGFFDEKAVEKIKRNFGKPDMITASSVFTHLEFPGLFFKNCRDLLYKNGKVVIEVEYLSDIVSNFSFERFYFDRPHYYSLYSLIKLAEPYGFKLEDAELINVHGGSIRATFTDENSCEISERATEILKKEKIQLSKKTIINKLDQFSKSCVELKNKIKDLKNNNFNLAAYGCPARFSTITNFAEITKNEIPYVIDDNPLKQGRYSPGKHIPIRSFNEKDSVDIYIVFAYEYIRSIKEQVANPDAKFFKPIPFQEL